MDFALDDDVKLRQRTIKIDDYLDERIATLINDLKKWDNPGETRKRWVIEAFKEYLAKSQNQPRKKFKNKVLSFDIDEHLESQIDSVVELLKLSRGSYSKKRWMIAALIEKIEKDEQMLRDLKEKKASKSRSK